MKTLVMPQLIPHCRQRIRESRPLLDIPSRPTDRELITASQLVCQQRDQREEAEQALLCTDVNAAPLQIVKWFVLRWRVEVTFQEARAHLGLETQRQWSDVATARTTPALLGLFSLVTLLAHRLAESESLPVRKAAWYVKRWPTFSDALAAVRHQLWHPRDFHTSLSSTDMVKIPRSLLTRFIDILCYAA